MSELIIPSAFKPLFEPYRYKVFYGGRGAAKSHNFARALLVQGMAQPLMIVCAREIQKSIRDSVHRLLRDLIRQYNLGYFYSVTDTEIRGKNGTNFIFRGLKHNTSEIKSLEGADRLWIEEAANVSNSSYELVIPTIRKNGSEIWISFNPKNATDPTYERFIKNPPENAFVKKVSWRDNPFFPDVLAQERDALFVRDPEAHAHVWEGELDTRRSGAVYAKQLNAARSDGRICRVPYDPACEVFTAWDLGFGDATAIWWLQFVGRELRWIDFCEGSGEQLDYYVKIVKGKNYNYMAGGHYLPHDGAHGNIRGASVTQQLAEMGLQNQVLPREQDIAPGIELLRQTIAFSVFDSQQCGDGLHALENYSYEWDEERSVFKSRPTHDWSSHAADAARYAALAAQQIKGMLAPPVPQQEVYYPPMSGNSWMG